MQCCSNPNIKSSTYTDWCTNCGWAAGYLDRYEETQDDSLIEERPEA